MQITDTIIRSKARQLEPIGGGDFPEATKTGLARAHELMRADATTIILLYTDVRISVVRRHVKSHALFKRLCLLNDFSRVTLCHEQSLQVSAELTFALGTPSHCSRWE
jgi:hypothetical protein